MNKLKIKLFGELWKLSKLEMTAVEYSFLKNQVSECKIPLDEVVHAMEGINQLNVSGLIDTYKNQIEIWFKGRKVQKMNIQDLNDLFSLFPRYNSKLEKFDYKNLSKGIYVEQKEIGLVAVYEMIIEDFNIFDLEFSLVEITNEGNMFKVLKDTSYFNRKLARKVSVDTLITRQYSFEVF